MSKIIKLLFILLLICDGALTRPKKSTFDRNLTNLNIQRLKHERNKTK